MDLLDLHLQKEEETAQSWASIQQKISVLQGEVPTMTSTQTELLTTMQRLDSMLQKMMPNMEQAQLVGGRDGTLSPIAKETQEQVASSGGAVEIEESTEEEQTP